MQINIKGYNDADKNKGGLLPDSFLLPPIPQRTVLSNAAIKKNRSITIQIAPYKIKKMQTDADSCRITK